jgi:hypothetical protein
VVHVGCRAIVGDDAAVHRLDGAGISSLAIAASAPAGSLLLTIGGGSCRAIAVVKDGVVTGLRYAGPGDSLSGRDAVCGTDIVRGCMRE